MCDSAANKIDLAWLLGHRSTATNDTRNRIATLNLDMSVPSTKRPYCRGIGGFLSQVLSEHRAQVGSQAQLDVDVNVTLTLALPAGVVGTYVVWCAESGG